MRQFVIFVLFLCSIGASAQDVIVKKDGSTIVCRIVEVNTSEIVYKKWTDLSGSNYVMNRADASAINYESGRKENLSEKTNLYAPSNQNDGTQQYNDKALLALNASIQANSKQSKVLKTIGWVGGAAFAVFGIAVITSDENLFGFNKSERTKLGGCAIGLSAVWTTSFLLLANYQKKKNQMLQASTLYQYDFKLTDNSFLSAGVDMINTNFTGKKTIGLGLRYNF